MCFDVLVPLNKTSGMGVFLLEKFENLIFKGFVLVLDLILRVYCYTRKYVSVCFFELFNRPLFENKKTKLGIK